MFRVPRWRRGKRIPLETLQDRMLDQQDPEPSPFSSVVDRHERQDRSKFSLPSRHPIVEAFDGALMIREARTLVVEGEMIGRCEINGHIVSFSYLIPQYRVILDELEWWEEKERPLREAWCKEHRLVYYWKLPTETWKLEEIAQNVGVMRKEVSSPWRS